MCCLAGYGQERSSYQPVTAPLLSLIHIFALTATAFAEDIQTAIAAGMNAHVAKPIDVAVLQATLGKVLHP